jgi:hypothetical protein
MVMQKTLDMNLSPSEASRIIAAIDKSDEQLREIFRRMKKDQTEINRLKADTKRILAEIEAEMKAA